MAQHEAEIGRHDLVDGEEVANKRTGNHSNQGPEQHINTQFLEFRILAAIDDGGEEQTSGEEAGGNPEHGGLNMPRTHQGVGEPLGGLDAVETLTFNRIVGSEAAKHDLESEQANHQQKILAQCFLGRRKPDCTQWILQWRLRFLILLAKEGPGPDQTTDTGNQENHTD